jgi:hypothetical protein
VQNPLCVGSIPTRASKFSLFWYGEIARIAMIAKIATADKADRKQVEKAKNH